MWRPVSVDSIMLGAITLAQRRAYLGRLRGYIIVF
jgi:hypothetical protein